MSSTPQQPPAGWYPDPAGSDGERFWDGVAWSQSTRDKPWQSTGPATAPGSPGSANAPYQPYGSPQPGYGSSQPGYGQQQYGYGQEPYSYGTPYGGGRPHAGFWWRVLGYILDAILVGIVLQVILRVTGLQQRMDILTADYVRDLMIALETPGGAFPMPGSEFTSVSTTVSLVTFAVWAIYRVAMLGTMSATLGQLAVGLRVVKKDKPADSKLTWGEAAVRGISSAALWATIGFLHVLTVPFTAQKQSLADLIAKTNVLKIR